MSSVAEVGVADCRSPSETTRMACGSLGAVVELLASGGDLEKPVGDSCSRVLPTEGLDDDGVSKGKL